jgi:hypothetical protein
MSSLRNIVYLTFLSLLSLSLADAKPVARRALATPTSLKLPTNVVFPSTLPLVASQSSPLPNPNFNPDFYHSSPNLNSKLIYDPGYSSLPPPPANLTLSRNLCNNTEVIQSI